jgi:hypothetical protein
MTERDELRRRLAKGDDASVVGRMMIFSRGVVKGGQLVLESDWVFVTGAWGVASRWPVGGDAFILQQHL